MPRRNFNLIFEIHGYTKSISQLRSTINKALSKYISRCRIDVTQASKNCYCCHIVGPLQDVDACHKLFNKHCLPDLHVVRIKDEAGDDVRCRTYRILSKIEQQLRTFINRVMTEVSGADWWQNWCPPDLEEKASTRKKKESDHQVEFIDFSDLLMLMTLQIQDWPEEHQIPAKELSDLLSNASDFDSFRDLIAQKLIKRSAWDDIFSKYIDDPVEWDELKNELANIILPTRNKVMHHRPVHVYDLETIKKHSRRLRKQLEHSRKKLDKKRCEELKEINKKMTETLWNYADYGGILASSLALEKAIQNRLNPINDVVRQFQERMNPVNEAVRKFQERMNPINDVVRQFQEKMNPVNEAVRKFQERMNPWIEMEKRIQAQLSHLEGISKKCDPPRKKDSPN